ncbi:hypothetical protein EVAR_19985_1 [Eumeta japonica]|uniref:Uncharacterized protein n=1 Tax=Eumeta variegata TaxID=151549 RepID=A0A4C1VCY1_EUMVA|nr:hypothetical protein EVAR_19985_1 [Eumeta japonica]
MAQAVGTCGSIRVELIFKYKHIENGTGMALMAYNASSVDITDVKIHCVHTDEVAGVLRDATSGSDLHMAANGLIVSRDTFACCRAALVTVPVTSVYYKVRSLTKRFPLRALRSTFSNKNTWENKNKYIKIKRLAQKRKATTEVALFARALPPNQKVPGSESDHDKITESNGGARRRRRRRPPTASRLKGPRKQKSLLLKRGLAKSFAYKLLKRGLANLMSPTSTSGVAPPLGSIHI